MHDPPASAPLPVTTNAVGALVVTVVVPVAAQGLTRWALKDSGDLELVTSVLAGSVAPLVFALAYFLADADETGSLEVPASLGLGMGFGTAAVTAWTWTASATTAWLAPGVTLALLLAARATYPTRRSVGLVTAVVGWAVGIAWSVAMVSRWWPA